MLVFPSVGKKGSFGFCFWLEEWPKPNVPFCALGFFRMNDQLTYISHFIRHIQQTPGAMSDFSGFIQYGYKSLNRFYMRFDYSAWRKTYSTPVTLLSVVVHCHIP